MPRLLLSVLLLVSLLTQSGCVSQSRWVGTWATAPQSENAPAELLGVTKDPVLRQVVRLSVGGEKLRLRFSNEYGTEPLNLADVQLALAEKGGAIRPGSSKPVRFDGRTTVTLPPKTVRYSDPLAYPVPAHADLAVTMRLPALPAKLAGHPGSRANSYITSGADPTLPILPEAKKIVHWYILTGIERETRRPGVSAWACLGDSITDGYGCQPDQNTRWTDALSHRLRDHVPTADIAVLNLGIGGGRLLREGLGPSALVRLPRDVLEQAGVRWVILQIGVNDLGTRIKAKAAGTPYASASDIIDGYRRLIAACHEHGIRVALATITPFAGADWYWTPDIEQDRQTINEWIRHQSGCDVMADFDVALRSFTQPDHLEKAYDSGDHLHPSMEGYRRMAAFLPVEQLNPP